MDSNTEFYASIHTAAKAAHLTFDSISEAIGHYRRANNLEHPQMTDTDKKMCALLADLVSVMCEIDSVRGGAAFDAKARDTGTSVADKSLSY